MDHMLFTNEISGQLQKERNNRIPDRTKDDKQNKSFLTISDRQPPNEAPQTMITCILSLHFEEIVSQGPRRGEIRIVKVLKAMTDTKSNLRSLYEVIIYI